MRDVTAVILAAGRGVRMGRRGQERPKGLLQPDGEALVVRSLALLGGAGVKAVRIVTGHLGAQYHAALAGAAVEFVHNPDYAVTGSLRSLLIGLQGLKGSVAILESDIVYERRALDDLQAGNDRVILSGPTGAGDEVHVWAAPQGGGMRILDMFKDRDAHPGEPLGELVGITVLSDAARVRLVALAEAICACAPRTDYEAGLVALAAEHPLEGWLIPDLAWAEIDDEAMYRRAGKHVLPRIRRIEGGEPASGPATAAQPRRS